MSPVDVGSPGFGDLRPGSGGRDGCASGEWLGPGGRSDIKSLFYPRDGSGFEDRYHQRSNVESTFGALKRKFGEKLFSRNQEARENELLARVVAYNICVTNREISRLSH